MLEKIREGSQGVIAKSILVLVILSFAFTGVSSYLGSTTETVVATVNGEEITEPALEQAFQNEQGRLEQQMGELYQSLAADENYLAGVRQDVLERLVAEKLLDQAAIELGLRISDAQIKDAIVSEAAFQTDGVFDNERYLAILRQLGYQPHSFKNMMRIDMTRRQLVASLIGSEFVLPTETEYLAEIINQTRNIRYHVIDSAPFVNEDSVTLEQAQAYYNSNLGQFMSPETISLEYLELDAKQLEASVVINDDEAQSYYDENKAQYLKAEERLAAHILVNVVDGDEDAAKLKAEALHAKLVAGTDFAELAKSDSDDAFSGENGGQLDWFEPGVMEPTFDDALYSLNKGEYSSVVKTSFGYHIIKLLDQRPGTQSPFADVKADIIALLTANAAADEYFSLQQTLANVTYEVPDTLSEAADELKLEVKSTPVFTRTNAPAPFDNPELLKAAFSATVLLDGMNSDVIEVGTNHGVVVRLKTHTPAGTLDFDKVKPSIVQYLAQQQANTQAQEKAEALAASITESGFDSLDSTQVQFTTKAELTRFESTVDNAITTKAFEMAHPAADENSSDSSAIVGTVALPTGYAVILLDAVNPPVAADQMTLLELKQRLTRQNSENSYRAVIAMLKAEGEVTYP